MNEQHKELETIRSDAKEIFRSCLTAVDPYEEWKEGLKLNLTWLNSIASRSLVRERRLPP
jgi:hypothetical protein